MPNCPKLWITGLLIWLAMWLVYRAAHEQFTSQNHEKRLRTLETQSR